MKSPLAEAPFLSGLIPATFTPFHPDGSLHLERIAPMVEFLVQQGVQGLYIGGSTGEGPSLSMAERKAVAEAHVEAAGGRLKTVIHVGHTALPEAQELTAHAAEIGADAISAVAPWYYKATDVDALVGFFAEMTSAAPELPFYYYHIPILTGLAVDPAAFLEKGAEQIPSLRGIKFTDTALSLLSACQDAVGGRFEVLFGRDEMLLPALSMGVTGAVGSTYNFAPGLYQKILAAVEAKDLEAARKLQQTSVRMISAILAEGGEAAMKFPMARHGLDCGPRRLPMGNPTDAQKQAIDAALDEMGFAGWAVSA